MTRLQIVVSLLGAQNSWQQKALGEADLERFFMLAERILAMEAKRAE